MSRVKRDRANRRTNLENLSLKQLQQSCGVENGNGSSVETKHDMAVIEGAVLELSDATLRLFKDVDTARFFARTIVDYHVSAVFAVFAGQD